MTFVVAPEGGKTHMDESDRRQVHALSLRADEREVNTMPTFSTPFEPSAIAALVATNGVGVWEWDIPADKFRADETVTGFFALAPRDASGGTTLRAFTSRLQGDDRSRVHESMRAGSIAGSDYAQEFCLLQGESERWIEIRGQCRYAADGTPSLFAGLAIDITPRKHREEEALRTAGLLKIEGTTTIDFAEAARLAAAAASAETRRQFRLMAEGADDHALLTVDPLGLVTSWNHGAERLLGHVEDQIVGRHYSCIFVPEDIALDVPMEQLRMAGKAGHAEDEGWQIRMDGTRIWATVEKTAIFEEFGEARGFAVMVRDITEKRKIAVALEAARQERSRLQEAFLSNVSHELRTPLTAIYFFVSNVTDGLLGEVAAEQLDQLHLAIENVNQLKEMVGDLLEITRVDSLKLTIDPQRVAVARMAAEVLSTCRSNAENKHITLCSDVQKALPYAWADPNRVRQILTNLVDNAIKFTAPGGSILVAVREFAAKSGFLHFSVTDTGCGISPAHLELIFDRLAQVKNGQESSREGLGIGLFIAKDLVVRHGGSMWVESVPGQGSTFSFTLPLSSVAGRCSQVLKTSRLGDGTATLIALDVVADAADYGPDIVQDIARAVERCIHPGQDVVLPCMNRDARVLTMFIFASTGKEGAEAISRRIKLELKALKKTARMQSTLKTTVLQIGTIEDPDQQEDAMSAMIETLVQEHLREEEITR